MELMTLRPEKDQRTLWLICWTIWFFIILVPLAFLVAMLQDEGRIVFAICLLGWLVVMFLVLLWIPAFYKSLEYQIEDDCVKAKAGVLWRKHVTVPFSKMTNLDVTQGPLQRAFDIGTIHVQTAGAGGQQGAQAELRLTGIRNREEIKDIILERVRGYAAGVEQRKEKISPETEPEILRQMLAELQAVRELLQARRE